MKKHYFLFAGISLMLGLGSCSDDNQPENNNQDEEPQAPQIVDLSKDEMANCYIVQTPGLYKFKADNMFNQGEGLPIPEEIHPESAELIWQTVKSSVSSVELVTEDGVPYIQFEIAEASGNALIAALDVEGKIEWSWHIWMPESNIESVRTSTGYDVMNMNLGAINNTPGDARSYGMLYQWGRKDPFPASATTTGNTQTLSAPMYDIDNKEILLSYSNWYSNVDNTIEYSIANPTVCISNYSQFTTNRDWLKDSQDNLWGNPQGYQPGLSGDEKFQNKGRKTCYDPSPAGWRVAPADAFSNLTSTGGYAWTFDDFNVADNNKDGVIDINDYVFGWYFNVSEGTSLYFPAASRFDGSYAMLMGSMSGLWGNYWSNSPYPSIAGGAFCALSFQTIDDAITVSASGGASRADAYSIRCIRDN